MIAATNSEMKNALAAHAELRCDDRKLYLAIGFKILEQFRRSYGENRSLEAAPGLYFRHDEFTESVCCLLQPMLVGWDAYYVPTWFSGGLDYFVAVSHDLFVDINFRTREMHERSVEILRGHDWVRPLMK